MTWHAQMIAADEDFAGAPLLRREFSLEDGHGAVTRATLALSAQGVVEAWLNGRAVSDDVLTPGWSSYEWRLRYATYDVTALVEASAGEGSTVLGIALGKGWFGGRLGWSGGGSWYGDAIGAFAQLEVEFADGSTQLVVTDDSWASGPSAVLANDLYDGETIDARLRDDAWKKPGFSGEGWTGAHALEFDAAKLEPYIGPSVKRWASLPVQEISTSPSGKTLVDFGQNLVGWIKVRVQGPAGTEVTIRHAEVLEHGELGVRPLRSAKATDRYILSGGTDEFEPTFTFHGFRYAEVSGWPGELKAEDLTAIAVGSELTRIGEFSTSDPLLNQFHENVVWGMRGNFLDVPTDCPQRDERLGWTGDIAAFAPTAAFLYDVDAFLSDWLVDLDLEQQHHDGIVGFVIPDVLKYHDRDRSSEFGEPDSTAIWSDAAVWVPWTLYQAYGDTAVLERQFGSMTSHVRRVKSLLSPSGVWDANFQFGDWLDPDAPPENPAAAKADKGVVATACAYYSARVVADTAALLGRPDEEAEFRAIADGLREAFDREYVRDGIVKSDCTTVYALAIQFGLLDAADEEVAGDRLAELAAEAGYRISTGFAGTPFIADALTKTGRTDVAYRLLLEKECPSWLYPVTMGATTVWERWDSMLPDGTINPGEMTSFNHYALGAVADWMHRVVGGLAPLKPGYASVLVAPQPGGGLTEAATSLETPHGRVSVRWSLDGDLLTVDAELPEGVEGILRLPGREDQQLSGGPVSVTAEIPASIGAMR
ncbi:alpha-L-rhamnosidase [Leifsonia sp. Leaf336]|uniref:alpha-L-rhamnosidase n=1 Tax=Leifsonia sp. Leaf336 TaxID=1736341 RepID=UPI0006F20CB6|nr:alpha-L-rhamnosidase [Leifsonia sp. Leaf336]KQR50913.1 alpha-L-rhamnosidase [Leifsonia sp. Leaf336]